MSDLNDRQDDNVSQEETEEDYEDVVQEEEESDYEDDLISNPE